MPWGLPEAGDSGAAPAQGYYDANGNWIASGTSAYAPDDFSGTSGAGDAGGFVNSGYSSTPTQNSVNSDLANLNQGNAGNNSATPWVPTGGLGADGMAKTPWQPPAGSAPSRPAPQVAGWMDISKPFFDETTGETVANRLLDPNTRATAWDAANPNAFANPGAFENFYEGVAGQFNNRPVATNRAEVAYDQYERDRPDLGPSELGTYYDHAKKRTSEDMNAQLAARGSFNTSRGVQQVGDALTGLEAERANREADHDLARSADARAWATGRSGAAQGADASSRGLAQTDLAQTLGYGGLALNAQGAEEGRLLNDLGVQTGLDAQEFGRLSGALNAGSVAGQSHAGRIGMGWDALFGLGGAASGVVGSQNQQQIEALTELEQLIQDAYNRGDKAAVAQLQQDRANLMGEGGAAIDTVGGFIGLGG